mmetsp:Transcript_52796/g.141404  ORF Transcript_52796/g.141404 Transcript_52796/m.141404 type:complete len:441 (-) Transcript_52796:273-1595(-)
MHAPWAAAAGGEVGRVGTTTAVPAQGCGAIWGGPAMRSQLDGGVLIGAGGNLLRLTARVLDGDLALDDDALGEGDGALDDELLAVDERGRALGNELVHGVGELVGAVKLDVGGHAGARLREHDAAVGGQDVGVGAQGEEVAGGLHGREARAGDDQRGGAREALDRGAHGGLQLQDLGGGLVARVHGLGVLHDGQGQHALVLCELLLQRLEVHPEVVGVEELVLRGVLEGLLVLVGALRGLAEQQAAALLLLGEVAALLVGLGAVCHLHHEGRAGLREVRQDLEVHGGSEVVGVRYKHVLEALRKELLQCTASKHRRVQVTVAGGAPLMSGILLPGSWREVSSRDLWRLVLHKLKVRPRPKLRVLGQGRQGVCGGREGVHEHEGEVGLVGLLHGGHLLGDEVQEALVASDRKERLCLVQAHAGAQAAVQLQNDRLREQARI